MKKNEIIPVIQVPESPQMVESFLNEFFRSGQSYFLKIARQWRFKKDLIDKWISEEALKRVTRDISTSSKKSKRK